MARKINSIPNHGLTDAKNHSVNIIGVVIVLVHLSEVLVRAWLGVEAKLAVPYICHVVYLSLYTRYIKKQTTRS